MTRTVFTAQTVQIEGLDSLLKWAKEADPRMHKALRRALKESMAPVLREARANGRYIQDDGTYADSLSIGSRASGAQYVLKTTDPAAGVKEYAKPGAMRLVGKSSRSSTQRARLRAGLSLSPRGGIAAGLRAVRVGVPHRAHPPRVMIPAVETETEGIKSRVEARLDEVLKEAENNG